MMRTMSGLHKSHATVLKRLQRAKGHLGNVMDMMEEGRPCGELAQQLHAVERAIGAAKRALIHDHLDHCVKGALAATGPRGARMAAEFKDITKYL